MLITHGVWTTTRSDQPGLMLWVEDRRLCHRARQFTPISDFVFPSGRHKNAREAESHPFAVDGHRLLNLLLPGRSSDSNPYRYLTTIDLLIPSQESGPTPSPWINGNETNTTAMQLEPWRVPSVLLPPPRALQWLMDPRRNQSDSDLRLGDSVFFWREAANLVVYCLIHGTYWPALREVDHQIKTHWVLNERILANQLEHLKRKLPESCQAEWLPDGTKRTKDAIIKEFFNTTIDFMIRNVAGQRIQGGFPQSKSSRRRKKQNPLDMLTLPFLKSAYSKQNTFSAARDVQAAFVALTVNWLKHRSEDHPSQWRACFTLMPPDIEGATVEDLDPNMRVWRVAFSLQHTRQEDHHVYAQDIWENTVPTQTSTGETLAELLLKGIGRALKHFKPLRRALEYAYPTHVDLTTDEAYTFLAEQTPHLQQAGLSVVAPAWWNKTAKPLKTKLKIDGSVFQRDSMMGFDSVVNFEWRASVGEKTLSNEAFTKLVKNKLALLPIEGQWVEIHPEDLISTVSFFEEHESKGEMRLVDAMNMGLKAEELRTAMDEARFDYRGALAQLFNGDHEKVAIVDQPTKFRGQLRPYQVLGLSWLAFHHHLGFGACLADDMGLGKTIQLLALLLWEREHLADIKGKPTLLVCPMSVVGNWHREAVRFAPGTKVMIHHGVDRLDTKRFLKIYKRYDLIITTYHLVNRDQETFQAVNWHRVVLDEAQNIKNPAAQQTQAIQALESAHRIALTGTPVENKLSELWSIMEFLNPGYLGKLRDFQTRFATPIEKQKNKERSELLRQLTRPFILRRLKTDRRIIKDLPEKIEMKVYCDLTEEQAAIYKAYVDMQLAEIEKAEGIHRNQLVLTTLMKLKQICNHPVHFLKDEGLIDGRSGKLMRLSEMMEEALDEGDKSLIFTQFTEMGKILVEYLSRTFEQPVLFLHGGVDQPKRQDLVDSFQSPTGPRIFVLTVKTGGTGLNLTAANHVFHYDRWWNPAVENQATDRAFRIGQKRNVQVHKLIAIGTLEDRIDMMIERKRELAENIIEAGENWIANLSTDALRDVLNLSVEQGDSL